MHAEAERWVTACVARLPAPATVLEIGSRNVNGSNRVHFGTDTCYVGVDCRPGDGVDHVAQGHEFGIAQTYDLVICTEVLEHTSHARGIVHNAARVLRPGGAFILTTAWTGRMPHSGVDGGALRYERRTFQATGHTTGDRARRLEHYANITEFDLVRWLHDAGFVRWDMQTDNVACDIRALAWVADGAGAGSEERGAGV